MRDFDEIANGPDPAAVHAEAERCMNCGAAFCQPTSGYGAGCPIDNRIPEWNELVRLGRWREAYERLSLTNNFPEFTSRVCPAPCQDACIHAINSEPIAIKSIERAIIDRAFEEGWVRPAAPGSETGRRVAVVGSGPAGLAAADQLRRLGHAVSVFERSDTPGGLLMYGIPSMKLGKAVLARRIGLLRRGGVVFRTGVAVGEGVDPGALLAGHDAVLLACGALRHRELEIPGRELAGVVPAMAFLEAATRANAAGVGSPIDARGLDVVVIGGGDTGADCIATALRQGCRSVVNITRRPRPPSDGAGQHAWPAPADVYRVDYAHAEGAARTGRDPRAFGVEPLAFVAEGGRVSAVRVRRGAGDGSAGLGVVSDLPAGLVVLAIGFEGHDQDGLVRRLGLGATRGRVSPSRPTARSPGVPGGAAGGAGVFAAGDCVTGPSLVVTAIAQGRAAAARIEAFLRGR